MPSDPLLAGLYDPKRTLTPERARQLVGAALAFRGTPRVEQWGPLTVGLAPAEPAGRADGPFHCMWEGDPRLGGARTSEPAVAAAWHQDGGALLGTLRGSFSMVLWDEDAERGLVVRDQMGQRPLLWHGTGPRLAFAGDIRPLLDLVSPRPAPDETAVACWLGSQVPAGDRTMFQGIRRLPGGHLLALEPSGWTPRSFWQPRYREPMQGPRADLLAGMVEQLDRATASVLDGARAPGLLLSGGIDSTTVAACAEPVARTAGLPLRTYSATFPDLPDADESRLIDDLINALRLPNTSMAVNSGSLFGGLLDYTQEWLMPDISANNFFWIELLRLAGQEGVDYLLDGEGGDELFLVPRYLLADLLRSGRLRAARQLMAHWPMIAGGTTRTRMRVVGQYGLAGMLPHAVDRAWWQLRPHESPLSLLPDVEKRVRRATDPASWKRADGPRWWQHLAHHMTDGPDSFGAPEHAQRIARLAGVRRRRPLLDLDLSEYVLRLPPEIAFSPWVTKGHIRAAMLDRVPDSILFHRDKTVFTDVRIRSLAPDLQFAKKVLASGAEVRRYVKPEAIEEVLAGPPRGATGMELAVWGFKLQHLAGTEFWLQIQADPSRADTLRAEGGFAPLDYDLRVKQPSTQP